MRFIFVDETGGPKLPDFLGIGAVSIDSAHYASFRDGYWNCLHRFGWQQGVEFKGSHMFSAKTGDISLPVDQRIDMVREIVSLNIADKNAKVNTGFAWNRNGNDANNYLRLLENTLTSSMLLPRPRKKSGGKHLCVVFVDYNSKIPYRELRSVVEESLQVRGYEIVEDVVFSSSSYQHVGICFADLISYLSSWICLGGLASQPPNLFDGIIPLSEIDERKISTIEELLAMIKRIKFIPSLD